MMAKDANIIELPVASLARRPRDDKQSKASTSTVIDLKVHSQARATRDQEHKSEDLLSAGEVWDALNDGRLVVHYQPQYDMQTGKTIAAEALVRLIDTDGRLVYPDRFIDHVEERDLIVPLGRAVIEQVCADLAYLRTQGLPIQRIAINLSAYQLTADTELTGFIDRTIARYGLEHADLEFELTERHRLETQGTGQEVLKELARKGARIVIDDFGVGYSSVLYLAETTVSAFKLDRSLIARLTEDEMARALVESLLTLAYNMGLDVVAEGVENQAQDDYLVAAGCPLAQGFGYARPMPFEELQQLVMGKEAAEYACADRGNARAAVILAE